MTTSYVPSNGQYAMSVSRPRLKGMATIYSIVATAMTLLPVLYGSGESVNNMTLKIYNLAGFSPFGVLIMLAPILLMLVYRQEVTLEKKLMLYFTIMLASVSCYLYCLREAFQWMSALSGEMAQVERINMYYFVMLTFECIFFVSDGWRTRNR